MRSRALAGAALALALALTGCGSDARPPHAERQAVLTSGSPGAALLAKAALRSCPQTTAAAGAVPDLTLPCLADAAPVRLARVGRPTVINLWASWCGPCATELPLFAAAAVAAVNRVQFLGVDTADHSDAGLATLVDAGVHYPSVADPQRKLQKELGLSGLPATVFVRADGSIAHTKLGAFADVAELRAALRTYLGVAT